MTALPTSRAPAAGPGTTAVPADMVASVVGLLTQSTVA
jgi:hypothetical protein